MPEVPFFLVKGRGRASCTVLPYRPEIMVLTISGHVKSEQHDINPVAGYIK